MDYDFELEAGIISLLRTFGKNRPLEVIIWHLCGYATAISFEAQGATQKVKKVQNGQINISGYTGNGNLMTKYVIYIFRFPDFLAID